MTSTVKRGERTMPLRDLTSATASPIAFVHANLMPPEVVAKRRLGWLKRRLAFALVALVALVGLGYGLSYQQTGSAEDELADTQNTTSRLMTEGHQYDELVRTQVQIAQMATLLRGVLTGSLDWSALLGNLNKAAPAGLVIDQVDGELADTTKPVTPDPTADPDAIGTLTLAGKARDYRSIARFVDTLGRVTGLSQVEPGAVTSTGGRATFEIKATLTKAVLVDLSKLTGGK